MEAAHLPNAPTKQNPSTLSTSSTTNSSSSSTSGTPKASPRSIETNPYPTTFVQADTSSFKQLVQMLTGFAKQSSPSPTTPKNHNHHHHLPLPPTKAITGPKKPSFKLYERRNSLKNLKNISPLMPSYLLSPRKQTEMLSPSLLDMPSLVLSPVTPLIPDPFDRVEHPHSVAAVAAEERAIAEKGFYVHLSPRGAKPRLLPLFPVTSPRAAVVADSAA